MTSMTSSKPMQQHGSSHRRLFELLQEQQEPFLLDVYLLEHGYSDTRVLKSSQSFLCWPWRKLRRLSWSYGFKRRREGFVRCALKKLVMYNKLVLRKALLACHDDSSSSSLGMSRTWSSVLSSLLDIGGKLHNAAEFHRLSHSGVIDINNEDQLHCFNCKAMEEDDESKQLSPVSVFELHSDHEASSVHSHSAEEETPLYKASNFEELLCSTASLIPHSKELSRVQQQHNVVLDCVREVEEKVWEYNNNGNECFNPLIDVDHKAIDDDDDEKLLFWEKQLEELANISQMIDFDISKSKQKWSKFQLEKREIGVEIETKIFAEIREETVLDLMLDYHCTLQTRY